MRQSDQRRGKEYTLHGFKYGGVVSHSKIIVGTPDLHLGLSVRGMGDREFGREPVDGVEVTVRLVVVLLLQFIGVELLIVEFAGVGGALLQVGRCPWSECKSSGLVSGSLDGLEGIAAFLRRGQLFRRLGGGKGLASVGTLLDAARGHVDAFVLVNLDDVDALREAGEALDELAGAFGEGGAHNRAFCGLLRELGETWEARRG
jgi:hypothetical protein